MCLIQTDGVSDFLPQSPILTLVTSILSLHVFHSSKTQEKPFGSEMIERCSPIKNLIVQDRSLQPGFIETGESSLLKINPRSNNLHQAVCIIIRYFYNNIHF